MNKTDAAFAGSIPALYDRYLGPMIFEPYALDVARRVAHLKAGRLLETAAGTGIVTRALASALPKEVEIVATDLNQPMLDFAAAAGASRVAWRQADAANLPFDDKTFDIVVCQFGVMFFPDRPAAYREALRVLSPNGRFIFNVWDSVEQNDVPRIVTETLANIFPADPPRFLTRIPYGRHEVAPIRSDLARVGFSRVEIETVARRGRAPTAHAAAVGFCQGTPLRTEIEARGDLLAATSAAADAILSRLGAGPIDGKIQAHVITAWR